MPTAHCRTEFAIETANDALGRRTHRVDSGDAFASTQPNVFGYNARSVTENQERK